MNTIEKAQVIYYHNQLMQYEDDDAYIQGWKNESAQQKRFEVLCSKVSFNDRVILDLGCGIGDFKGFLNTMFRDFVYIGIDHIPAFIATARQRYENQKDTWFAQGDFTTDGLPDVDYVVVSGALNYQTSNDLFLHHMIEKMFRSATKGILFNLLDEEKFSQAPYLRAYNKSEVYAFCKQLSPQVALIEDYCEDDFTIVIRK